MNFGQLEIATLWRLKRDGIERRAAVLDSPRGPRLVITESSRIIHWETFPLARQLRRRAVELRRTMRRDGWTG